jgi:glycosyltransferase involved in cell wall biosynthesis
VERLNVLALPVGGPDVPSTRYRLLKLVPRLSVAGIDVRVIGPGSGRLSRGIDVARAMLGLRRADLVLIQKRLIPPTLVRAIDAARTPIVFDIDDALFVDQTDPGSPSAQLGRVDDLVRRSRLVIAGNEYLADWARGLGADVRLIPTGVDCDAWSPAVHRPHEGVVLGWMGTSSNLRYLEAIATPLLAALDAAPEAKLVVVSDRPPAFDHPSVEYRRWTLETELAGVSDLDIGLMPLSDDPWTRGKCAFKALQCMSLGLPVIASPVGANADVIDHGRTGLLAGDADEWSRSLSTLIGDAALRASMGAAAREAIVARHDVGGSGIALAEALRYVADAGAE